MRGSNRRGQTLVEVALVLPLFAFAVWMLAQLSFYCLNIVEHQRMAQVAADQSTRNSFSASKEYHWFHGGFGPMGPVMIKRRTIPTPEQKDYRALGTVNTKGLLVGVEVSSELEPPRFMGRRLSGAIQRASAEVWWEPEIPRER